MKGILFFIVLFIILVIISPKDTTDRSRLKRSGLRLYVDTKTGCHYIKGGMFGQMVPRLGADGKQICGGWEYERSK